MSAPSAIETPVAAADARRRARLDAAPGRERTLRLVDASTAALLVPAARASVPPAQPRSSSIPGGRSRRPPKLTGLTGPALVGPALTDPAQTRPIPAEPVPAEPVPAVPVVTGAILTGTVVTGRLPRSGSVRTAQGPRVPLRLTRRGRIVVTVLLVAVFSVAVLLVTALVSGRAQATNHGQPRAGYQGMHQIVVRPGQTLWSIASSADPAADPRNVVQEIMTANALGSPSIAAGQLLWVP
jgi:LysM domain